VYGSANKKGKNHPMFGKKNTGSQPTAKKIKVQDLETNISTTYDSMNAAARALNIPQSGITYNLKSKKQKPYKGRSVFKLLEYFV